MTEWNAFTIDITDHVAQVTLIGPGKGNAMGRDFWRELPLIFAELDGDRGAADYLRRRDAETVECADLATGQDVDRPQA